MEKTADNHQSRIRNRGVGHHREPQTLSDALRVAPSQFMILDDTGCGRKHLLKVGSLGTKAGADCEWRFIQRHYNRRTEEEGSRQDHKYSDRDIHVTFKRTM